jgi:hypothetical protein
VATDEDSLVILQCPEEVGDNAVATDRRRPSLEEDIAFVQKMDGIPLDHHLQNVGWVVLDVVGVAAQVAGAHDVFTKTCSRHSYNRPNPVFLQITFFTRDWTLIFTFSYSGSRLLLNFILLE